MIVSTGENRSTMRLIRYSLDSIVARSFREFAYMFIIIHFYTKTPTTRVVDLLVCDLLY